MKIACYVFSNVPNKLFHITDTPQDKKITEFIKMTPFNES